MMVPTLLRHRALKTALLAAIVGSVPLEARAEQPEVTLSSTAAESALEALPRAAEILAEKIGEKIEEKTKLEEKILERLSDEQLAVYLANKHKDDPPPAVAIVVPLGFFITVVGVIALVMFFRGRNERLRHETMRIAMERGLDIPTELLLPKGKRRSDLRRGLVLFFGGLGLMMLLAIQKGGGSWAIGLFPFMIGLGYLAFWYLDRAGWDGPTLR